MKIKKQQIFIGVTLLIILIIGFLYLNFNFQKESPLEVPFSNVENIKEEPQIEVKPLPKINIDTKIYDYKIIKTSLIVLDKKYETEIKEGSSVFDVMKQIEEKSTNDNLFNFKYTEHSGLGSFITEINGIKGTPGKYWIYYVNNEKASVGVSKFVIKEGDIISWKQEGI